MKRIICALFISALVFLYGCSDNIFYGLNTDSLNTPFQAEVNGEQFSGYLSFDGGESMTVTMNYPDNIRGYTLTFCNDTVITSYDNVENFHSTKDFSDDFFMLEFYKAVKTSLSEGKFRKITDSSFEMKVDDNSIITDSNGNITSAKIKNSSFIFK